MICINIQTQEIRELSDELVTMWRNTGNPKAQVWQELPAKPSAKSVWNGESWVVPTPQIPETVTARQIRLWLISKGISLSSVDAAIEAIPDMQTRETVRVEWEYAPCIERSHPMLIPLATALGLDESQVDAAFIEASII